MKKFGDVHLPYLTPMLEICAAIRLFLAASDDSEKLKKFHDVDLPYLTPMLKIMRQAI
jgi:hypothetical protein